MLPCGTTHRSAASSRCLRCPETARSLGALPLPISDLPEIGSYNRSAKADGVGVPGCPRVLVRHAMSQAKDMPVRHVVVAIMLAAGPFVVGASLAFADGSGDPAAVKNDGGKYYDKEGNPTIQGAERRDGGLVHLFRIPPLSLRIAMSVMVPTAKDRVTPARITLCGYAVIPISASSRMAVSVARPLSVSVYAPLSRL